MKYDVINYLHYDVIGPAAPQHTDHQKKIIITSVVVVLAL